jgi:hypothetical protein
MSGARIPAGSPGRAEWRRSSRVKPYLEAAQPATLPHGASSREPAQFGQGLGRESPLFAGEVVDELGPIAVVLAYVVVVDGLLDQPSAGDESIDRGGCCVGRAKERLAVDLVHDPPVELDDGVRPDHLQVEDEPAQLD